MPRTWTKTEAFGHFERVRHLAHCRDALDGRFRAVIARAVDVDADLRDIAACHPQQGVWSRLDHLDVGRRELGGRKWNGMPARAAA